MVTYTRHESTDDPEFVAWVEAVIQGVEEQFDCEESYVVKIDHWFGKRWLRFSGKALGALGVRKHRLTLPPFVPSRVVSQRRFFSKRSRPGASRPLHKRQRSSENLQRRIEITVGASNLFWFSGGTAERDRGSFMAYVLTDEGHWPWYVGLRRADKWHVAWSQGIGPLELREFQEIGERCGAEGSERPSKFVTKE
jgi:hypothetical protein